ncbi:hypothetical protein [Goodfellowiella coeruleoviolacea]|uniref:Alpha/beta hydrolase n=1 Tax=Goodfellowiella coeruleoviolacea TaxID=334858 RepID=A0AAE3G8S0_9PSEU|nr:hypothetical protein [Goodfellowiella coeruleoviolacea]MCP2163757.1 hypothetical protein [Goodfellowiella coeruleoviolacea]
MRDFDANPARAQGPAEVWAGPVDAPTVVVLDPAGEAKHGELPASWRELSQRFQVVWCRLPVDHGQVSEVEDVFQELAEPGRTIDVVASGPIAQQALDLVARHPGLVRKALLVDPEGTGATAPPEATAFEDALWKERTLALRRELAVAGTSVEVVAWSWGGDRDRVEPPLPLGHPDVVSQIERALATPVSR